jgi:hypothetical protein
MVAPRLGSQVRKRRLRTCGFRPKSSLDGQLCRRLDHRGATSPLLPCALLPLEQSPGATRAGERGTTSRRAGPGGIPPGSLSLVPGQGASCSGEPGQPGPRDSGTTQGSKEGVEDVEGHTWKPRPEIDSSAVSGRGLRYEDKAIGPGAQTGRQGEVGPD